MKNSRNKIELDMITDIICSVNPDLIEYKYDEHFINNLNINIKNQLRDNMERLIEIIKYSDEVELHMWFSGDYYKLIIPEDPEKNSTFGFKNGRYIRFETFLNALRDKIYHYVVLSRKRNIKLHDEVIRKFQFK